MLRITFACLTILYSTQNYAQNINLNEMILYSTSTFTSINNKLLSKGWKFHSTKKSAEFKTYTWYYNGKLDNTNNKQVIAKYWIKKVYSINSSLTIVDYQCKYNEYESLLTQIKSMSPNFNGSNNDGIREYDSYLLGNLKIDFIRYLSNNGYGVIVGRK